MLIAGALWRARVYQLVVQMKVLESAKRMGFNHVRFKGNKGGDSWIWELYSPDGVIPRCDRSYNLCVEARNLR